MGEQGDTEERGPETNILPFSIANSSLGDVQLKARLEDSYARLDTPQPLPTEPDGGYGWVCVVCMLLIIANTWGVNGAFGVYLAHYLHSDLFPNASATTYAFIGGLSISQMTFIAPLVTYVSRTIGTRPTLAIGVVLETLSLVFASFATKVWHLCLTQGLCFGWGCSFLFVGSVGIVPQWFNKRRSFATSIAASGSGLGGLAYSLGAEAMIDRLGLRWSFRVIALSVLVMNSICALLMRDRNRQISPNQQAFDLRLLRNYRFLLVLGWSCLSTLGYTFILFSIPDQGVEVGLGIKRAATAGALVNLGMGIGRPIVGFLSDKIGVVDMSGYATFLCGLLSLLLWPWANSNALILTFSFLGGTVCGTFFTVIAPLLTEILGIEALPAALSIIWTSIGIPTAFAEPIALRLRQTESPQFLHVKLVAGFVFILGSILMLALRYQSALFLSRWQKKGRQ